MDLNPLSALFDVGNKIIDRVWPDPQQAAEAKLKLAEMQQSGELAQMANETELFKASLADVDSARKREEAVATSENAPYLNKIITPVLAIVVTVGGGWMIYDSQTSEVRMLAASLITLVLGYYFGTSIGASQNRETINKLIGSK